MQNPCSSASLKSSNGPRYSAAGAGRHMALWAAASGSGHYQGVAKRVLEELPNPSRVREAFRAPLVGTFSKTWILGRARKMLLELKEFRTCFETCKLPPFECPARVASRTPCGYCATGRGNTVMLATQFQWTLLRSSLSGSEGCFRAILKSTFSKTTILVLLKAFWKLRDFRTRPETFEMGPTRMPRSNR